MIQQPAANQNAVMVSYGAEGASNPGHDLYVINNTFLNDDTVRGTFVMVGASVTRPVLMQNNLMSGTGAMSNQVGLISKTNYRSVAPGFINRAAYDLRPTDALVRNSGSAPGRSLTGLSLTPVMEYRPTASGAVRRVDAAIDIGAIEASQ